MLVPALRPGAGSPGAPCGDGASGRLVHSFRLSTSMMPNLDKDLCAKCHRPFDGIAVWVEFEEPLAWDSSKLQRVARPMCRTCCPSADLRKATEQFVCAGCGIKAAMPSWVSSRCVPLRWKRRNYWVCSPKCAQRARGKAQRWKQRICEACNRPFSTTRNDARFCSDACRQWAHRRRASLGGSGGRSADAQ
jgi:hypothetical protein